jgi:hypothetical protein
MASGGSLTIQPDGSLAVQKHLGEDTAALDATLSTFAEPASTTETQSLYQLTAASIWRARRQGLSLANILQTLETHSPIEMPANVRADIERWSKQIDRLSLEANQGRLLLRSDNPLVITAVRSHRTLGAFVADQIDATTWSYDRMPTQRLCSSLTPANIHSWTGCKRGGTRSPRQLPPLGAGVGDQPRPRPIAHGQRAAAVNRSEGRCLTWEASYP